MCPFAFKQMTENREVRIHCIEQPEVGDVRGGEIRQALILLPATAGEMSTTGRKYLDQAAQQTCQIFTRIYIDQGRNEAMVQHERARFGALYVGDAQGRAAFAGFTLNQQTYVLPGNLNRLRGGSGVFIAE